jgi:hypothetical protein
VTSTPKGSDRGSDVADPGALGTATRGQGKTAGGKAHVGRRAAINVTLVEHDDDITMHFDASPASICVNMWERPNAYAKLRSILDDLEIVEELPEEVAS